MNAVTDSINTEDNHNKAKEFVFTWAVFMQETPNSLKTYLESETSKSTGVKTGRIKADDRSEKKKNPIYLRKDKTRTILRHFWTSWAQMRPNLRRPVCVLDAFNVETFKSSDMSV